MTKWIRVDELLPYEGALVVGSDGATRYSSFAVFKFFNGKFYLQTDGLDARNYDGGAVVTCEFDVTHWIPLPTMPEYDK